jgi:hypothetical protein
MFLIETLNLSSLVPNPEPQRSEYDSKNSRHRQTECAPKIADTQQIWFRRVASGASYTDVAGRCDASIARRSRLDINDLAFAIEAEKRSGVVSLAEDRVAAGQSQFAQTAIIVEREPRHASFDRDTIDIPVLLKDNTDGMSSIETDVRPARKCSTDEDVLPR